MAPGSSPDRSPAVAPLRTVALLSLLAGPLLLGSSRPRPAEALRAAPALLSATGLYSDTASGRIAPGNLAYVPQYPLWTDGAQKRRWIRLPPGGSIDGSDPDAWKFPVGTRIWKEFAWGGRRVETRMLERTRAGWLYATYAWDEAGTDAVLAPPAGLESRQEVAPGRRHRIPGVADCKDCHQGGRAEVLGFGTLELSPDRDPIAPHREPVSAEDVTLPDLVRRGLLRGLPPRLLSEPPRIAAATPRGRAALGYLHANCGICHDAAGPIASIGLFLRWTARGQGPPAGPGWMAVGHLSRYRARGAGPGESRWIAAGEPSRSTIVARMADAAPAARMPPLGTQLPDAEALDVVTAWIREDLAPAPRR